MACAFNGTLSALQLPWLISIKFPAIDSSKQHVVENVNIFSLIFSITYSHQRLACFLSVMGDGNINQPHRRTCHPNSGEVSLDESSPLVDWWADMIYLQRVQEIQDARIMGSVSTLYTEMRIMEPLSFVDAFPHFCQKLIAPLCAPIADKSGAWQVLDTHIYQRPLWRS